MRDVHYEEFSRSEMSIVDAGSGTVDAGQVYLFAKGDGYTTPGWPNAEDALQELEAVVDFLRRFTAGQS